MRDSLKKYINMSLSIFAAAALAITFFFCFYRADDFSGIINNLVGIFKPFIYGAVIAYLLIPYCNICQRFIYKNISPYIKNNKRALGISNKAAILIALITAAVMIYIFIRIVLPQLVYSIVAIVKAAPGWFANISAQVEDFLLANPKINDQLLQIYESAYTQVQTYIEKMNVLSNVQTVVTQFSSGIFGVLNVFKNLFIGLVAAVYIMANRKIFRAQSKKLIYGILPVKGANAVTDELHYADSVFSSFIVGKVIDSAIIGVIAFIVLTFVNVLGFMNVEYVLLLSVIIGVTNIVPFFGPFIGAIPCVIIVLMQSPIQSVYFLIFILILQQVDGNIIGPKILGNSTGLSGFWVFFSILLFSGLWGFVGMLVGVPVFAVIYDIIKKIINHRLQHKNLPQTTETYLSLKKIQDGEIVKH